MIKVLGKLGNKVITLGPKNAVTRDKISLTAEVYNKLLAGKNVEITFKDEPAPVSVPEVENKVEEVEESTPTPVLTEEELGTKTSNKK